MRDLQELLSFASQAVDLAGGIIRSSAPGALTAKGDRDMASEVDFTVEREVRKFLSERTPEIGCLGEEEGTTGLADASDALWVLDPIDGTANFVHGLPLCAVSLGLVHDGNSIVGVVDLPLIGERYTAVTGGGAQLNGQAIHRVQRATLAEAVVAIGDYAVGDQAEEKNRARLRLTKLLSERVQRVRMFGSAAIDLVWVASGRLDASVMFANKPWDTTAGVLIARESRVEVFDIDGSRHDVNSSGTVAAAEPLTAELLAIIEQAT